MTLQLHRHSGNLFSKEDYHNQAFIKETEEEKGKREREEKEERRRKEEREERKEGWGGEKGDLGLPDELLGIHWVKIRTVGDWKERWNA